MGDLVVVVPLMEILGVANMALTAAVFDDGLVVVDAEVDGEIGNEVAAPEKSAQGTARIALVETVVCKATATLEDFDSVNL